MIDYRLQFVRIARDTPTDWPKVIIFIAPKRTLLHQQIESIRKFCHDVKAEEFGGAQLYNNKHIDDWGCEEWRYQLQNCEVLGMTPAILQNLLEKSILPPRTIDLLVLDECHHAAGNDPMAKLCDAIKESELQPLILGLTASPVKSKRANIRQAIEELEERTMCTFFLPTEDYLLNLQRYAFKPPPIITTYDDCAFTSISDLSKGVLGTLQSLFRRLSDADFVQQLHDSDLLFKRDAFKRLYTSCGLESKPMLIHYPALSTFKECIRQTYELVKSCGLYFGFQCLIYYQRQMKVRGRAFHRPAKRYSQPPATTYSVNENMDMDVVENESGAALENALKDESSKNLCLL